MTEYNFDQLSKRHGTCSLKYDGWARRGKPEGLLPLWVGDMDFAAPPCVIESMEKRVRHGIFGYSEPDAAYDEAVCDWFARRHQWQVKAEWLLQSPGVVTALHVAIGAYTEPGDAVLIQPPVYHPFFAAVKLTGRKLITNPLVEESGRYHMDFVDLEHKIKTENVKLMILCSPHNPVGRVWEAEELAKLGAICLRYGVIVVADEIHQDFVFTGQHHTVLAAQKPEFAEITVTCTSPSKSFNLAGLNWANIIISNPDLRRKFSHSYAENGLSQLNVLGLVACQAAYTEGADWLDALVRYLEESVALVRQRASAWQRVEVLSPEGTYLLWLDCRGLGLEARELSRRVESAGVWLSGGESFGVEGEGFMRLNIACPRVILHEALDRLDTVFA
jgi:cystathionine beta-lyase